MYISCALFHTSRRHLPQKGGLRATSRQIIFFHFRFMHIMFRWFSATKIYAAPAHAVTNMFHRLQLLLNATFLAHNETLLAPIPGRNSNGGEPPSSPPPILYFKLHTTPKSLFKFCSSIF